MSNPDVEYFRVMYGVDPFFLETDILVCVHHFGISPEFDDRDRLRAYLAILDLERKTKDKSGSIGGFLLCASIWGLSANTMPFAQFSELFRWLGLSHGTSFLLNIVLLVGFWMMMILWSEKIEREKVPLWKQKDKIIDYLLEEIQARHRRMAERDLSPSSAPRDSLYQQEAQQYYPKNVRFTVGAEDESETWFPSREGRIRQQGTVKCPHCRNEFELAGSGEMGFQPPLTIQCETCCRTIFLR